MSNVLDSVKNTSYVNKDFQSIFPELLDLVKQMTTKWIPSDESDPGVILLKLNALLGDKLNYNIDKNVLECFPLSVTQERNARQMYEQLGYKMHWYNAPTTEVTTKWIADTSQNYVTIPAFTMISNSDTSTIYTLVGPANATSETNFVVADQVLSENGSALSWKAIQGTAIQYDINGETVITAANLDSDNRIYFNSSDVAQNGIFITNITYDADGTPIESNNYSDWVQKDNLLTENLNNTFYSFGVTQDTEVCYLEFPEDAENVIKNGIMITYIRTKGLEGNLPALALEKFYADVAVADNQGNTVVLNSDNVKILNYQAATDGENPESIADAYHNYSKTVGTFDTLVTLRDYINYIITHKKASNGFLTDRSSDPQCCYKVVVNNDGISQTTTQVDEGLVAASNLYTREGQQMSGYISGPLLTAYDLKLYLLNYTTDFTSVAGYNSSFTPVSDVTLQNIESYIEDQKSISHDYKGFEELNNDRANICFLINRYPVSCRLITKYQLSDTQAEEVKSNVVRALYKNLNSQKVDFSQNITTELLNDIIVAADSRIKSVSIDNIEYSTHAVYWSRISNDDSELASGEFKTVELTSSDPNYVDCLYEYSNASKYQPTSDYYKYDFAIYNGHRYMCTKDVFRNVDGIPAKGPFNSAHWQLADLNLKYPYENYQTLVNTLGFGNYRSINAVYPQSSSSWEFSYNNQVVSREALGISERMLDYDTQFRKGTSTANASHTTKNATKISVEEILKASKVTGDITEITATTTLLAAGVRIVAPTNTDPLHYIQLPEDRLIKSSNGSFTVKTSTQTSGVTFFINELDSESAAQTLIPNASGEFGATPVFTFRVSIEEQMRDEIYGKSVLCGATPLYVKDEVIDYKWTQFKEWDSIIYKYVASGNETKGAKYKFTVDGTIRSFEMPAVTAGSEFKYDVKKDKLTCNGNSVALSTTNQGTALTFEKYEDDLAPELLTPVIDDVETIITDSTVRLTSVDYQNRYKLKANESIQMYRPNLIDTKSYSNYVKMEHVLEKDVLPNQDYQLSDSEYIAFYWKVQGDASEYYSYYIYGPGSIIKPSFGLQKQKNSGGSDPDAPASPIFRKILNVGAQEDPRTVMDNIGTQLNPVYVKSFSNGPAVSIAANEDILKLTKTYWVLSGSKEVVSRRINEKELTDSYQYYIISNNVDSKSNYIFEFNDKYEHNCTAGEAENKFYFIVNGVNYYFVMPAGVTTSDKLVFNTTNKRLKLNGETSISVGTDPIDGATETYFRKTNLVSEKILSTGEYFIYTNNAYTDFVVFGAGTRLVQNGLVGTLKSTPVALDRVLTEGVSYIASENAWSSIPTDGIVTVQENQYLTIAPGNYFVMNPIAGSPIASWSVNMNHEGCTFSALSSEGSQIPGVTFSDFDISYGTDLEKLTNLDALKLADNTSWNARTLLSLSISDGTEQILYSNQKIEVIQFGSTTSVTIQGSDKVGDLYPYQDSSAQTNWYRSSVLATEPIEFSGEGEYSAAYYDTTGAIKYPTIYLTSKNITNSRVAYTTNGDVMLMFGRNSVGTTSESFRFNLPDGDYIIKFLGSSSVLDYSDVHIVVTDDAGSTPIEVKTMYSTDSTEVPLSKSTFLRLKLKSGFDSIKTMTVTIPRHNERVNITLYNPFRYTYSKEIDKFYFDKMESIINKFDTRHQFDYTYQVSPDNRILYPLKASSFLNANHPYYKYTICKMDTDVDFNDTITVLNKK